MSDARLVNALLVDDDTTGRGLPRALLKRAGYAVEAFYGSRMALLPGGLAGDEDEIPARALDALHEFRGGTRFADDLTLVELYLIPTLFESTASAAGGKRLARPAVEAT